MLKVLQLLTLFTHFLSQPDWELFDGKDLYINSSVSSMLSEYQILGNFPWKNESSSALEIARSRGHFSLTHRYRAQPWFSRRPPLSQLAGLYSDLWRSSKDPSGPGSRCLGSPPYRSHLSHPSFSQIGQRLRRPQHQTLPAHGRVQTLAGVGWQDISLLPRQMSM